jgi:hypothetical protein
MPHRDADTQIVKYAAPTRIHATNESQFTAFELLLIVSSSVLQDHIRTRRGMTLPPVPFGTGGNIATVH